MSEQEMFTPEEQRAMANRLRVLQAVAEAAEELCLNWIDGDKRWHELEAALRAAGYLKETPA